MPDGSAAAASESQLALAGALLPALAQSTAAGEIRVEDLVARLEEHLAGEQMGELADALAKRKPRALYAESQRIDWNTPEEGLFPVYETVGTITLDPCSNPASLVKATRAIYLPEGASELDPDVGGLAVPWDHEDVFANIPFGKKTIPLWVAKAIASRHLARSITFLMPSYTSTHWFDRIWETCQAICFWGKPGKSSSRLTFGGAANGAGFAVMYPLWTTDHDVLVRFARAFSEVGQVVFPDQCRAIAQRMSARMTDHTAPDGDLLAYAERKLQAARYDDILTACVDVQDVTLGELMASNAEALKMRLGALSLREILEGLSLRVGEQLGAPALVDASPHKAPASRSPALPPGPKPTPPNGHQTRDAAILASIEKSPAGLLKREIRKLHPCTDSQLRGSLERLKKQGKIQGVGPRTDMRYTQPTADKEPPK